MEQFVIFNQKTKTVYHTYYDDDPDPHSSEIVMPNWTDWNPFKVFGTTLEEIITNEKNASFYIGTNVGAASRVLVEIIKGIKSYNANHPNNIFDDSCLIISTMSELKVLYQKELIKSEYLLEENEDKALKIYLNKTNDYSVGQAFMDGIKWGRRHIK